MSTDYMKVAEQLYKHQNPSTRMDVPSSMYEITHKWYREWANTETELDLFDWCLFNKN